MQITVLSATKSQHTSKAGKPYQQLEVAYKGEDGQVKGKKIMPFGTTKSSFDALSNAQAGEIWEVTAEKEGDFWVWTSAKKSDGSGVSTSTPSAPTNAGPITGGKVVGSNYETKEERAQKQIYIVRQSSLANAIAMTAQLPDFFSKSTNCPSDIIDVAKQFEDYVFGNMTATAPAHQALMDMDDDVPL